MIWKTSAAYGKDKYFMAIEIREYVGENNIRTVNEARQMPKKVLKPKKATTTGHAKKGKK